MSEGSNEARRAGRRARERLSEDVGQSQTTVEGYTARRKIWNFRLVALSLGFPRPWLENECASSGRWYFRAQDPCRRVD